MNYLRFLPFYLLSLLPFRVLYLISDVTFFLIYHVLGYRSKVVYRNLEVAFPHKTKKELKEIAKKFYKHFCDLFFEAIKLLTVDTKEIQKRFKVHDLSKIHYHLHNKENILLYTAHQGNWEWLTTVPIYFDVHCNTLYKPLKNAYFNDLFILIRQRFNVHCIPSQEAYRKLLTLKNQGIVAMNCVIGDQSPPVKSGRVESLFFDHKTTFFNGAAKIAKKTDAVVLLPYLKKEKRGTYELFFETIVEKAKQVGEQEIVELYSKKLEDVIEAYPELYLWTHKRWKRDGIKY
ncbi:MAG: lysophospholipid acyltransferase family protein [Maribacter sp.]